MEPSQPADSTAARWLSRLLGVETALAVAALLGAAAALVADLVGRELLGQGLFGAQRAAVHLCFIAGMFGFVLATARGAHLRVKASDALIPERFGGLVDRLGSMVSVIILLLLAWYGERFVQQTFAVGERSPTLGMPIWPIQTVMLYAFVSAALRHLAYAIDPRLRPAPDGAPA
jgi:TRAP-type C4-dicarboxylate transport system permease small subunit